jgi:hypothetical protein
MFQNQTKRRLRRAMPITGYTGANGGGKSAAMVWDTMPSLAMGRTVLSTVRLLDWENPRPCDDPTCPHPEHAGVLLDVANSGEDTWQDRLGDVTLEDEVHAVQGTHRLRVAVPDAPTITHMAAHPCYVPFTDWQQLLDAEHCDVLMDEVTGVASSRESQSMPSPVANKLVQLRRADVVVRWSAPNWKRADVIIRECSQAVVYATGYLAKTDRTSDRQWRNRRLFRWQLYDAADFEDFTAGKREQLRPQVTDLHWGPSSPVFAAYDTFDAVSTIGSVTDSGRCYRCGGRRSAPRCTCPDHATDSGHEDGTSGAPAQRGAGPGPRPTPLRARTAH